MAIETLTICQWSKRSRRDTDITNPSWEQVEAAIMALNNQELNDVYLLPVASKTETYLAICGGDGRYFVTGSIDNDRFPTLVDLRKAEDEKEDLISGGQRVEIPSQWVVDLDTALEAVKSFYEAGDFSCGVEWQFV